MQVVARQESRADHGAVFGLIKRAFAGVSMSDHREHLLVDRLRQTNAFIPELSIIAVASASDEIIGHILLTKIKIVDAGAEHASLALAPVSVLPEHQGKGIGGLLINRAHEVARALGHRSVVLLGHEGYYPRFGYLRADHFGVRLPFEAPAENCMAIELEQGGLAGVSGIVQYPAEFFE